MVLVNSVAFLFFRAFFGPVFENGESSALYMHPCFRLHVQGWVEKGKSMCAYECVVNYKKDKRKVVAHAHAECFLSSKEVSIKIGLKYQASAGNNRLLVSLSQ